MEDIRDEALGRLLDQWASSIEPDPTLLRGLTPKRPRRDRAIRLTASIAVAAIFVAVAAWGVTVVGRNNADHTEGPTAPSLKTVTNPKGIPITVSYPGDWFARQNSGNTWLFGNGLIVVNDRREANWDHLPGDSGPFGTHIRDFVGVTVFKARHQTPGPTDSSFPLDMADAKVDTGWGQESVRYLNAQIAGMPIRIMVFAAKDASPQDIAAADAIVASIRPNSSTEDLPPSPPIDECALPVLRPTTLPWLQPGQRVPPPDESRQYKRLNWFAPQGTEWEGGYVSLRLLASQGVTSGDPAPPLPDGTLGYEIKNGGEWDLFYAESSSYCGAIAMYVNLPGLSANASRSATEGIASSLSSEA